jgi:hypothetical protein
VAAVALSSVLRVETARDDREKELAERGSAEVGVPAPEDRRGARGGGDAEDDQYNQGSRGRSIG